MPEHGVLAGLEVDAMQLGGCGRFINDNRFRCLSYSDQERIINVEAKWMFWKGVPHLVFFTVKPIKAGGEVSCASSIVGVFSACTLLRPLTSPLRSVHLAVRDALRRRLLVCGE